MGKHRSEDGQPPKAIRGTTRTRSKVLAGVVAAGALTALGQPLVANAAQIDDRGAVHPSGAQHEVHDAASGKSQGPVQLLAAQDGKAQQEAPKVDKAKAVDQKKAEDQKKAADQKAAEDQKANGFVKPAEGRLSSGYGDRGGQSHKGIDIANQTGTPIKATTSGEVISAGPASGFGQWVRVQHGDGNTTIYGHVNTIDTSVGQHVDAGQQIATMGEKGQASGPHLHLGLEQGGERVDPTPWLNEHGISVE